MNRHLYLNTMYRCCGSDRRNNFVRDLFTESIDARLSVKVLPSLYFQMYHHSMYMNNDHHFCICFMHMYRGLTVSDFISCAPEFIMSIEGIFATESAA